MSRRVSPLLLVTGLLVGCAGPGPNPSVPATAALPQAIARFIISIPADKLRAKYVSTATASVSIKLVGNETVPTIVDVTPGQGPYTVNFRANAGRNSFDFNLYDNTGGTGNLLSTTQVGVTLTAGQANVVPITTLGVPASILLQVGSVPSDATPLIGASAAPALSVTVKDAAGKIITGTYNTAITLNSSGVTNGAAVLSTTTVPNDATAVTINYNGATNGVITYSATAGNATSNSVTLTPVGPLVLSSSTIDILGIGSGLIVTASQVNGTVGASIGTCTGIATVTPSGPADSTTLSITGVAVGTCTLTVTGTNVPNKSIDVGVSSTSLTIN